MSQNETQPKMKSVPIKEFLSAAALPVDIFVKLSDAKFVMVAKAGEKVPSEQLVQHTQKGIDLLYIHAADYDHYVEGHINIAGILLSKAELNGEKKTAIVSNAAKLVFDMMENGIVSESALNHAKEITKSTISLVEADIGLSRIMDSLNECSDQLVAHSVAVSAVSVMIARTLGWKQPMTLQKLALGGQLHDIGKKELPIEIITKARAMMTPSEVELYETHAYRGMKILSSLGTVPDDVLSMVYEHHELAQGQGFPRRLRNLAIQPLARVIGLANAYCELIMAGPNTPIPRTPAQAIFHLKVTQGCPFAKEDFRALETLVVQEYKKA